MILHPFPHIRLFIRRKSGFSASEISGRESDQRRGKMLHHDDSVKVSQGYPEGYFGSVNPLLEVKYSPSSWWKLKTEAKYSAFYWSEAEYVTESLSSVLESLLSASKIPLC